MKQINKKTKGFVMAGIGFLMIVYNAIRYLISDNTLPVLLILGLVFVVIGINLSKDKS